jgi:uncharacterized iron-regulated protein
MIMNHAILTQWKIFCLLLFFPIVPAIAQNESSENNDASTSRIQCNRTGETIDLAKLTGAIENCDVIFLGEQHDNDSGHRFQLDVITSLVSHGHHVVISMEQFERDTQGALDDYLAGRIDEQTFLTASRPWGNYKQHYQPIIEFARENKLPVIAGNIPRRIANNIASGDEVPPGDQAYIPRTTSAPKDVYWQKFKATMQGHMGTDSEGKMEKFYASQCLKDDAMAEAITDYIAENTHHKKIVVHLCGHFHSDFGLGTVARVVARRPLTQCAVITMETVSTDKENKDKTDDVVQRAHYTFWTVQNATKQPEKAIAK